MTKVQKVSFFRKRPAPRYGKVRDATSALLRDIRPYDVLGVYQAHQTHSNAVALCAARGWFPVEAVLEADAFANALAAKTGWTVPPTYIELYKASQRFLDREERPDDMLDPGVCWRLFLVSRFPEIWQSPPSLREYRDDIAVVQQAALYYPATIDALTRRMSEKYDGCLWIVGEHYTSWRALMPTLERRSWADFAHRETDSGYPPTLADRLPADILADELDAFCEHLLYEIREHQSHQTLKGRKGDALLAKVVEECWRQWRWAKRPDPTQRSVFPEFYRFVMAAIDVMKPPGFTESGGTNRTVKRYLRAFIADDHGFGYAQCREDTKWAPPGAARGELVEGHSYTVYGRGRRNWWPCLKVIAKSWFNMIRGYPSTINNHDRFW